MNKYFSFVQIIVIGLVLAGCNSETEKTDKKEEVSRVDPVEVSKADQEKFNREIQDRIKKENEVRQEDFEIMNNDSNHSKSKENILNDIKIEKGKTYKVPDEPETKIDEPSVNLTDYIPVKVGEIYIKYHAGYLFYYDKEKELINFEPKEKFPVKFEIPSDTHYIKMSIPVIHEEHAALIKKD